MLSSFPLPRIKGKYRKNAPIGRRSWLGVGGSAEVLFVPQDIADLKEFLIQKSQDLPLFVLGKGSNLLIRDGGISGVTIMLGKNFGELRVDGEKGQIIAGAGASNLEISTFALKSCLGGMEFLSTIPGGLGGALSMNAGCYGADIANILVYATSMNLNNGEIRTFAATEIGYGYRSRRLSSDWFFLEAVLQGIPVAQKLIKGVIGEMCQQRDKSQPRGVRTCGSLFTNTSGYKAWELIDRAGCRGLVIGGAQMSPLHCNFLVNNGNAIAKDAEDLIEVVRQRVYDRFGIHLKTEVVIVGNPESNFED